MEKIFKTELVNKLQHPSDVKVVTFYLGDEDPLLDRVEKEIDLNAKEFSSYDITRHYDEETLVPVYNLLLYK